jgi:hypothetical protein
MMHTVQKSRYTKVYDEYMHTVGGGLYRPFNWLQPSEGL